MAIHATKKSAKKVGAAGIDAKRKKGDLVAKRIQKVLKAQRLRKTNDLFFVTRCQSVSISVWVIRAISPKILGGRRNRFVLEKVWVSGDSEFRVGTLEFPFRGSVAYFVRGEGLSIMHKSLFPKSFSEIFHTSPIVGYFEDQDSAVEFAEGLSLGGVSKGELNRDTRLWSFKQHHPKIVALSYQDLKQRGLPVRMDKDTVRLVDLVEAH